MLCGPAVVAVTFTRAIQEPFVNPLLAGIVALIGLPKVSVVAPAVGAQVGVPPQVVLAPGVAATCMPDGKRSVNLTPVNATLFSLVSVKVKVELALTAIGSGEKTLVRAGGWGTPQPVKIRLSRMSSAVVFC